MNVNKIKLEEVIQKKVRPPSRSSCKNGQTESPVQTPHSFGSQNAFKRIKKSAVVGSDTH